jgi:hypothetical protein
MNDMVLRERVLDSFEENYRDAKGYHNRAKQFLHEEQSSSVVFNVASVALERYLIALCNLYGINPGNHNYRSLMDSIEIFIDFPSELNIDIRNLDLMFDICSLEKNHYGDPNTFDSDRVLSMCDKVEKLFH